jgi:hypothetical protein
MVDPLFGASSHSRLPSSRHMLSPAGTVPLSRAASMAVVTRSTIAPITPGAKGGAAPNPGFPFPSGVASGGALHTGASEATLEAALNDLAFSVEVLAPDKNGTEARLLLAYCRESVLCMRQHPDMVSLRACHVARGCALTTAAG